MTLFSGVGLTCVRGDNLVFHGLDFACTSGDLLVLIGPNGSGKSSLLRILAGLLLPMAGKLLWNGRRIADELDEHHSRLHYVGHYDCVKPVLSVYENIFFWSQLCTVSRTIESYITMALDTFAISHLRNIPGRLLSAGQKRRVNLARIIATPAFLWLLDEPMATLDEASVNTLRHVIARHRANGGIVILSTHQKVGLENCKILDLTQFSSRLTAR